MNDLFAREQQIYNDAVIRAEEIEKGDPCGSGEFKALAKEYGRLLRQLRRITKISDKTTYELNTSKIDLTGRVHFDALTDIYNRRFMDESLKRIIKTISGTGRGALSVLMLDVDFFKDYNDTYGHSAGDACLKLIAAMLKSSIKRDDDFVARYGGEEFIVVLPNTEKAGACFLAERILKNTIALGIPHENNEAADCVTISIGVTSGGANRDAASYIRRADEALYISKKNGRNKYTFLDLEEEN